MTKLTDRQIKANATQREKRRVFDDMNSPQDIRASCSDGAWYREAWRNPSGSFGWGPWKNGYRS